MAWTRRKLRTTSALCLALLFYAAIPHLHDPLHDTAYAASGSDSRPARPADRTAGVAAHAATDAAAPVLRADLAHESHSSDPALDAHPCALCRDPSARALAAVSAVRVCPVSHATVSCDAVESVLHPELLLARRHPTRAPPRA